MLSLVATRSTGTVVLLCATIGLGIVSAVRDVVGDDVVAVKRPPGVAPDDAVLSEPPTPADLPPLPPLPLPPLPLPMATDWDNVWGWHLLPNRLIYRPYLAGVYQPRMAAVFNTDRRSEWKWDLSIGARVGLLRYGSGDEIMPQGWQLDMEGAAFPRLALPGRILEATDYRFGVPLSYGRDRYQMQIAYCHISSHLGDEWSSQLWLLQRCSQTVAS